MTKLLLNLFVPNHANTEDPKVRGAIGSVSGIVGICANLLLFLGKLLVGFRLASKPADRHHPYGHARIEYLSGLGVSVMIMLVGFELAKTSVEKILHPSAVAFSGLTAAVLLASIGVKLWLCLFNQKLGTDIDSTTLLATAADSRNDCVATGAVLMAALIEHFLDLRVDGLMGLCVAAFILYSGWGLAMDTISPLLGEGVDEELRQKILDYIRAHPKVLGYHDLMVHDYGPGRQYASLHVEMDCREDPLVCHEIIDDLERECLRSHGIHLVIHYDPVVTDDLELIRLKKRTGDLLRDRDRRMSLHDFRMVPGQTHMNLVFDVTLPTELQGQEAEIQQAIQQTLNAEGPLTYHVKITFDLPEVL